MDEIIDKHLMPQNRLNIKIKEVGINLQLSEIENYVLTEDSQGDESDEEI